jgi:hypothetical protein
VVERCKTGLTEQEESDLKLLVLEVLYYGREKSGTFESRTNIGMTGDTIGREESSSKRHV